MLRAVLLGILTISAAAACSKKADAPAAAVGAAAGKVVEIAGKVDATREGKTRTLALGAEVFRDDQIATSADATVTIELFHNNAKWSVVSNKQARVDASLAWGLDKQEASKAVEHNSAAAGRNAERSAADTASTTTAMAEEAKPGAMQAPTAPITESAPAAEPVTPPVARGGKGAPSKNAAPTGGAPAPGAAVPPPPPPPPPPAKSRKAETMSSDDAPQKDAELKQAPDKAAVVITPQQMAERQRPAFQKCLDPQAPKVTITIKVRMNKTTVSLAGPGNITDKVRSCVDAVAQKIEWPVKGSTFEVVLKLD